MKKKLLITSVVILMFLLSFAILYIIPVNMKYIEINDVFYMKIGDSSTGKQMSIFDKSNIDKVVADLNTLRLKNNGISLDSKGFMYSIDLYDIKGDLMESVIINSSNMIKGDLFFQEVISGSLNIELIDTLINGKKVSNIVDNSKDLVLKDKDELFYSDGEYDYYLPTEKSSYMLVNYDDGSSELLKDAFLNRNISIKELDEFEILYSKEKVDYKDFNVEITSKNISSEGIELIINNNSVLELEYGDAYYIEKKNGNYYEWVPMIIDETGFRRYSILENNKETSVDISWELLYGELSLGDYRISTYIIESDDYLKQIYYTYFTIS